MNQPASVHRIAELRILAASSSFEQARPSAASSPAAPLVPRGGQRHPRADSRGANRYARRRGTGAPSPSGAPAEEARRIACV